MTNTVTISFNLDTIDPEAKLGFEFWIDSTKHFDTDHVLGKQHVCIEISDDDAEHDLKLVMKNKTAEHTQIDEAGKIIADARLKVTDIAFDNIQLGHMVTEQATYQHDFNGAGQPTQEKFYSEIGCNGTVSLKFTTPIYLWLLEHM